MRKWRKKKQRKQKKTSANRSNAVKPNQIQSIKDGNNNNDNSNNNGWDMISDRGLLGEKKYFLDPQNSEEESNKKIGERTKKNFLFVRKKKGRNGEGPHPEKEKEKRKKSKKKNIWKNHNKKFPTEILRPLSLSLVFFFSFGTFSIPRLRRSEPTTTTTTTSSSSAASSSSKVREMPDTPKKEIK